MRIMLASVSLVFHSCAMFGDYFPPLLIHGLFQSDYDPGLSLYLYWVLSLRDTSLSFDSLLNTAMVSILFAPLSLYFGWLAYAIRPQHDHAPHGMPACVWLAFTISIVLTPLYIPDTPLRWGHDCLLLAYIFLLPTILDDWRRRLAP